MLRANESQGTATTAERKPESLSDSVTPLKLPGGAVAMDATGVLALKSLDDPALR